MAEQSLRSSQNIVPQRLYAALAVMHETLLPREFPGGRLRRLHTRDRAAFQAYRSLPELGRYQGWSPMSDAEAHEFLDQMHRATLFTPGQWVQLGIAMRDSDELVGDIGLYLSEDGTSGEVGFTLEPSSQGRGVAALAVREALQLLFSAASVTRVLGITDERNVPSIKLLERAGFELIESRQVVFRGEPCTERVYALPRNDG
jgi:RimJ/RimL family protein N-acetyltransferase